jgi:hypothetical protein
MEDMQPIMAALYRTKGIAVSRNFMNCFQRASIAWIVCLVLANRGISQEHASQSPNVAAKPGEVNTQFSRVFIFV